MAGILTKQILLRVSEEEFKVWQEKADAAQQPMNVFVRRVMAHVCEAPELIDEVDARLAAQRVQSAATMREARANYRAKRAANGG